MHFIVYLRGKVRLAANPFHIHSGLDTSGDHIMFISCDGFHIQALWKIINI